MYLKRLYADNLLVPPHSEGDSSIYSADPITLPPPPTGLSDTRGGSFYSKANRDPWRLLSASAEKTERRVMKRNNQIEDVSNVQNESLMTSQQLHGSPG